MPEEIAKFSKKHREFLVYSTYQSLQAVIDARVKFDLAICDEAHKTATARHNEFALVHTKALKVRKRLYMTATPRVLSYQAKANLGDDPFKTVADMSDEDTFGPEFHRMGFGEAIDEGILSDYKIVVVGVNDRRVYKHIEQRTYLEDASADQVATSLALQKAMKEHRAAHALTFHSSIRRAKAFKEIHGKRVRSAEVEHVNGSMSTNDRLMLLDEFRDAPHAVLTNARCLTEGVDVPAIDCVAFVDPRHSKVDIVQAAGRALRIGDGTKAYGVILIPLFYQVGEDPEEIVSRGVFKNVFEVVRAMADHDTRLRAEITALRLGEGKRANPGGRVVVDAGDDEERIVLEGFEASLKRSLFSQVIERIPTLTSTAGLLMEQDFARELGVSLSSVMKWRHAGKIAPHGFGFTINRNTAYYHPDQVAQVREKFGVTLSATEGLLPEHEFARLAGCGYTTIKRWRRSNKVAPRGFAFAGHGVCAFYHPDQVEEVRKKFGATIRFAEGLLTERQLAEALGVSESTALNWKTSGKVSPYASTFDRPYYHPKQVEELRRKFGVTLTSTKGLLSEIAFASALGVSKTVVAKLRKAKKIAPRGFGFNRSKVGALYHPDQIEKVMQQFGITLTSTDGLLSETTFAKKIGKSYQAVSSWRKAGRITPAGYSFNGAFYAPDQVEEVQELMGLVVPEELLCEKELAQELGVSVGTVRNWRAKNKIEPAKQVSEMNRVRAYYHPDQVEEIREHFGVTLDSTHGLRSEKEFAKDVGASRASVSQSRLKGRIKPAGYGFRHAGVGAYYHPDQVKEYR